MIIGYSKRAHHGGFPPILIFPEGATSNSKTLMRFKKGAFSTGYPVQSVLIKYQHISDWIMSLIAAGFLGSIRIPVGLIIALLYGLLSLRSSVRYGSNNHFADIVFGDKIKSGSEAFSAC